MIKPVGRSASFALSLGAVLLAAGCGGGKPDAAGAAPAAVASDAASTAYADPRDAANKWLPLKPGTQWVREGTTLIGKRAVPHKVVSTVTDVIREINGVKALLVLDEEIGAGQTVDKSIDYLAQDTAGNIWWMGGVTEAYEAGKFVEVDEAWLAGKNGAKAGILVPAEVTAGTKPWVMAAPPEEKRDEARFVRMQPKECVPFDCYKDVLVVQEGLAPKAEAEYKYYASGVGQIRSEPKQSHDEDTAKLSNVTQLSPEGLTEASTEALRIDTEAAEEETAVFGDVKAARTT